MDSPEHTARIDSWIWSVRLIKTRSQATAACRAGRVRLNGERVKPAHQVRAGDQVRVRQAGAERTVVVTRILRKRVSAAVAADCYVDHTSPPAGRDAAAPGLRGPGAGAERSATRWPPART